MEVLAAWLCVCVCVCAHAFSVEELLKYTFARKISGDIYADPCKGLHQSDIAVPNVQYELELRLQSLQGRGGKARICAREEEDGDVVACRRRRRRRSRKDPEEEGGRKRRRRRRRWKRAATARKERVWDSGVIPYEIDAKFSGAHKGLFKQAMRHWENQTCVKFVEREPVHASWITFTERPCGCCSFVGKRGEGSQAISIGKNCDKFGIVVHELGHVVGFWHEHTRPDRDDHVKIIRENILDGQEYNFNKLTAEEVNSLGQSYDFDSIMHYARNTFSKSTLLDTILPIVPDGEVVPEIGQRKRLSQGDIAQTKLLYKCPRCGETLLNDVGTFSEPPSRGTAGESAETTNLLPAPSGLEDAKEDAKEVAKEVAKHCEWRIVGTHGELISLNISSLDLPKSDNCKTHYVEVRDGYWHLSPLLGRYCGKPLEPIRLMSTGSRLLVSYVATSVAVGGFTAHYEAVCGGEIVTQAGGHLESPNYPNDYRPNKECVWKITVPEGYQVALIFQAFEIENHDDCVYDYVEVRDGPLEDSPLIGKYCGYKVPENVKSTSNRMLVKFKSDGSVEKSGFSAVFMNEYDECADEKEEHRCEQDCVNTLGSFQCSCRIGFDLHSDGRTCENACGGMIEQWNGTITSPSFPDIYPSDKECTWEIIAPPQYRITLNFTHFDLEGQNQDCEYDRVEVRSKLGEDDYRDHGLFCGSTLPPMITSEGNSLRIRFASDTSIEKSGFAAVFFTDKDECAVDNGGCQHVCKNTIGSYVCSCHNGFTLQENGHDCKEGGCKHVIALPEGDITSPNYPDSYPSRKDCVWLFTTTPGHRIKLVFVEFEVEPHQNCAYDHIEVYDGPNSHSLTKGRFCGSKLPHPIVASSNQMFMTFKSDSSVQRRGFKARHTTVCGGHLEANETLQSISSHAKFGDQNYPNAQDCDWTIEAPPGTNIRLTFSGFELEEEPGCEYDYVEVFAGYDDSSASYGKHCGSKIPPEIMSVNEALLIRFHSDDTVNMKGFLASYQTEDPPEKEEVEAKPKKEKKKEEVANTTEAIDGSAEWWIDSWPK